MLLAALTLALACRPADDSAEPPPADKLNLVMILADTLRADRLGVYGHARDTSPNLDAWAADAAIFDAYTSQAGITIQSVPSVFTGLPPAAHGCCGADPEDEDPLISGVDTLAEQLSRAGWRAAGFYKSNVVGRDGVDQGFESFEPVDGPQKMGESAAGLTDAALDWLDALEDPADGGPPFFLYAHYLDPHAPYQAPGDWYERFDEGYVSDLTGASGEVGRDYEPVDDDVARVGALYDGEIAYMDSELARLLDAVTGRDDTVVVFLSDHGEQLWDHGGWLHEHLYQEAIQVPLILQAPGIAPGRIPDRVQGIDLAPTLAGLVGAPPAPTWTGRDLGGLLRGEQDLAAPWVLSQLLGKSALISPDGVKYISYQTGEHLYDLNTDPGELNNLAEARPDELAAMRDEVAARLADAEATYAGLLSR